MVLLQLGQELFVLEFQRDHQLRNDLLVFEVLDLLQRKRAAVQNPTVNSAVGFLQALLYQFDNVAVWQHLLGLKSVAVS